MRPDLPGTHKQMSAQRANRSRAHDFMDHERYKFDSWSMLFSSVRFEAPHFLPGSARPQRDLCSVLFLPISGLSLFPSFQLALLLKLCVLRPFHRHKHSLFSVEASAAHAQQAASSRSRWDSVNSSTHLFWTPVTEASKWQSPCTWKFLWRTLHSWINKFSYYSHIQTLESAAATVHQWAGESVYLSIWQKNLLRESY